MARAAAGSMSVLVLRALVFGAMSRGIDARTLAERAGVPAELLTPQVLGDPDGRVLAAHVLRLWEFLPSALADESFGLSLAALAAGARAPPRHRVWFRFVRALCPARHRKRRHALAGALSARRAA